MKLMQLLWREDSMKEVLKNYLNKKRMERVIYNWEMTEDPSRDGTIKVKIRMNINNTNYDIVINVPKFSNTVVGLNWFQNVMKKGMIDMFQKYLDKWLEV